MTGLELYRWYRQHNDLAYSADPGPAKSNRIFKAALVNMVEAVYRSGLVTQGGYDKLKRIIATEQILIPNNNKIYLTPLQISVAAPSGSNLLVTFTLPHNLAGLATPTVTFSGLVDTGTPGANPVSNVNGNTYAVTVISATQIQITPAATITCSSAANSGQGVFLSNNVKALVDDYEHLLTLKAKMESAYYDLSITDATNTAPIKVSLDKRNRFRNGSRLKIANVLGNTGANGEFYAKQLNEFKIAIYSDKNFQSPAVGVAAYTSGGTIYEVFYNVAKQKTSDEKAGLLSIPTARAPYWEFSQKILSVLPSDVTCSELTMDYITKLPAYIDVEDDNVDLELYYPLEFLFDVASEAGKLYSRAYRDEQGNISNTIELTENP